MVKEHLLVLPKNLKNKFKKIMNHKSHISSYNNNLGINKINNSLICPFMTFMVFKK